MTNNDKLAGSERGDPACRWDARVSWGVSSQIGRRIAVATAGGLALISAIACGAPVFSTDPDVQRLVELIVLPRTNSADIYRPVPQVVDRIVRRGPAAAPALLEQISNQYFLVRFNVVSALGRIGDSRAGPALLQALRDSDYTVRAAAAEALGRMRERNAVAALLRAAGPDEPRPEVRAAAITALGAIGDPRAVDFLVRTAMSGMNPVYADAASMALVRFTGLTNATTRRQLAWIRAQHPEWLADQGNPPLPPGFKAVIWAIGALIVVGVFLIGRALLNLR